MAMCLREQLEQAPRPSEIESSLRTAPATGVNEGPSEREIKIMLAPTLDAACALLAELDDADDDSTLVG